MNPKGLASRRNQQSTLNNQQSTLNNQQSTLNNQQSTINNQQSTINNEPILPNVLQITTIDAIVVTPNSKI